MNCCATNGALGKPLWSPKGSAEHSLGTADLDKTDDYTVFSLLFMNFKTLHFTRHFSSARKIEDN